MELVYQALTEKSSPAAIADLYFLWQEGQWNAKMLSRYNSTN